MHPDVSPRQFTVPARIVWHREHPLVELRRVEASALDRAFWDELCAAAPVTALVPLDSLPVPAEPGPLQGGIFHTYRCGSTLLCRQLSALPGVYAIAEPDFLSQLVLGRDQDPALLGTRILKVLALLAQGLGAYGEHIVVKWPGLLADRAAVLVKALPRVPMVFLHRDPVEVLASIERRPLGNIAAAPAALGLLMPGDQQSDTALAAAVIAQLCRRIGAVGAVRRCDYARLDPVRIARHFGLEPDQAGQAAMAAAGSWYSKAAPGQTHFADDGALKRAQASAEVLALARQVLAPALAVATAGLAEL